MGGFCLLVNLHREGSALQPTQQACVYYYYYPVILDILLKFQLLRSKGLRCESIFKICLYRKIISAFRWQIQFYCFLIFPFFFYDITKMLECHQIFILIKTNLLRRLQAQTKSPNSA